MARKFLYVIAGLIVLTIAGAFVIRIYQDELTAMAFVPDTEFVKQDALAKNKYEEPGMWYSIAGKRESNPTLWQPDGAQDINPRGPAAIFFVHPTSYISKDSWNAPLENAEVTERTKIFLRGLASPFASAGEIWAPKYRQATVGAFLTKEPAGQKALDAAYEDVLQSFDRFIEQQQGDRPIILAGHSQGSRHLTYLLRDRVAGKPLAKRIVAAYVVGWPISITSDLDTLGLPACSGPDEAGCIMSWQSFAEPADYKLIIDYFGITEGFNGMSRKDTNIVCTNPLNGGGLPNAQAEENLGTLKANAELSSGELIVGQVPARCDERGFLLIGDPVDMGAYVLPGNNYHVYDYPLFWANVRQDALRRTRAFLSQNAVK